MHHCPLSSQLNQHCSFQFQSLIRFFCWLGMLLSPVSPLCAEEVFQWTRFDGVGHNRISREMRVPLQWTLPDKAATTPQNPAQGPSRESANHRPELWQIEDLHGIHSPLFFNDKLYQLHVTLKSPPVEGQPPQYRLLLDAWLAAERDPQLRFRHELPEFLPEGLMSLDEAPSLPVLVGNSGWRQLFYLLPNGELHSLDSDLGNRLWSVNLPKILGEQGNPTALSTPLVFEHLLIISACWQRETTQEQVAYTIAFDRRNSQIYWLDQQVYKRDEASLPTSPQLAPLIAVAHQGQVLLLHQLQPGTLRFSQIRTGKLVQEQKLIDAQTWATEFLFEREHLLVLARKLAAAASPPNNSSASLAATYNWDLQVFSLPSTTKPPSESRTADQLQQILHWNFTSRAHVTGLLLEGLALAATEEGKLFFASLKTPQTQQTLELSVPGKPILLGVDRQILLTNSSGLWQVFRLPQGSSSDTNQSSSSADQLIESVFQEQWAEPVMFVPAVSKLRYYLQLPRQLVAMGLFDNQTAIANLVLQLSDQVQEKSDGELRQLQLIPARQTLLSGKKIQFQALAYNAQGVYVGPVPAEELTWEWNGPGKLDSSTGTLSQPIKAEEAALSIHRLTARWKNLAASAEVRLQNEEFVQGD